MPERTISHYRILEKLGEGGMGEVYLAEDTHLDRMTALKLLSPRIASDPDQMARFRREAKTVAALNHPNIVTIYSIDESDGQQYLTMELVEGRNLDEATPPDGLPLREFLDLAVPLADAMRAAHDRGITHRDLKPANVMVSDDGRVKVLDFGLAKLLEGDRREAGPSADTLTIEGTLVGTVPYMSPEQLKGQSVDHRSDIFSAGTLLFEMVTGRLPFEGETPAELISSILRDSPDPVNEIKSSLPGELGQIIDGCLAKEPDHRIQNARELYERLAELRKELELGTVPYYSAEPAPSAVVRRESVSPVGVTALPRTGLAAVVSTRWAPALIMVLVFGINLLETVIETRVRSVSDVGTGLAADLARAFHGLEGYSTFHYHDATSWLAVYGYSISYFFLFPLLAVGIAVALAARADLRPFRVYSFSIAGAYAVSLPFFVFFPVPERWAHPEAEATLLSDQWTSMLIETFRPISGLDNCFPSFHVSLTVITVLIAFLFRMRLRTALVPLAATVVLSTFVLGIHWVADIAAGAAVGVLAVWLAVRLDRRLCPGR